MEVRRSTEMRYDILAAAEGRARDPGGYASGGPRLASSTYHAVALRTFSCARRVIVGFRAFWPRSIVFRLVEGEGEIDRGEGSDVFPAAVLAGRVERCFTRRWGARGTSLIRPL